jgi:hypothetical protein
MAWHVPVICSKRTWKTALSIRTGSSINVVYKALRKTIVVGAINKHQKFSYTWKLAGYPEIWIEIRRSPTEIVIVHCSISFGDDKSIKLDEFYFTNLLSSRPPFGEHHERRTQGRLAELVNFMESMRTEVPR